jgi:hypothetical protein
MSEAPTPSSMTREQARAEFKRLVDRYGLQWNASVPREAYDLAARIHAVLSEKDCREALGLRV